MMKHLFAISLLLLMVGCSSSTTTTQNSPHRQGDSAGSGTLTAQPPRVALIMKSLANDFFSAMAVGAEAHHSEHAGQYQLLVNGIKDESDLGRQVALVDEMVAAGVDAIVIAPADSKALVPALRRAMQSGVVVVNIDNRLDSEVLQAENITIPFVGPDNQAGAEKGG